MFTKLYLVIITNILIILTHISQASSEKDVTKKL